MPSTRDIRRRIKSVKNTAQITKAMQMVAASKMKKAQQRALAGRPYAEGLYNVLLSLQGRITDVAHPFLEKRDLTKKQCVLVISTDKGLCGGLNTNLFREALKFAEDTKFVSIGKKARVFFARTKKNLIADFVLGDNASFLESKQISKFLVEKYLEGEINSVKILYPHFVNTLIQTPKTLQILPIGALEEMTEKKGKEISDKTIDTLEYIFEPSAHSVLEKLLEDFIHYEVYEAVLEARASEHSARMVAMKSATDNAKQLVKDLTLEYNKVRQASITNEILEISSAAMTMS
jgi:F-type H+-transporting ATPase subunit gamma